MSGSAPAYRTILSFAAAGVVFSLLLGGFAAVIHDSQSAAHDALTARQANRAALSASFTRSYVDDIARQERVQAERLLSAGADQAVFAQVVQAFDFDAAVLLDDRGRLLQVWPANPEIIGKNMTVDYVHLRTAVNGRISVSEMVPSAANGVPIAAIAVPFDTPAGRRVLSGAFSPTTSPLGVYFASINAVAGSNAYLLDGAGHILASGHHDATTQAALQHVHAGVQSVRIAHDSLTVAVAAVPDTPWRVALTVPTSALYAPAASGRWAAWALLAAFALVGAIAVLLYLRLRRARRSADSTARTDALTGLANRRAMEEHVAQFAALATRHGQSLVAAMVDLDHFKAINSAFGHQGGDAALRRAAERLRNVMRAGDIAGRWGGEEFLILLPNSDDIGGVALAERIRLAIAHDDGRSPKIAMTASIGVAVFHGDADLMLRQADSALYEAKAAGRNRTIVVAAVNADDLLLAR